MNDKIYKTIRVEEAAPGVLKVILSRPERLNAMDYGMLDDLLSVSDGIRAGYPERYRAVVLCGDGRAFSSGGDIQFFQGILDEPPNVVETIIARFHWFARLWYELPLPTIAALSGAAAGGGAALALLCDIRYAAPDARVGFSFVKVGLIPDMGSHFTLPALIGRDKALELLYTGDSVPADEAMRIGLISRVVPRERLEPEAVALAARLAAGPPDVLRTIKELTRESRSMSLAQVLAREVTEQARLFKTPGFRSHIRDFLGRR
jgi:2-(1,2-epoxy-1,2-dihydrophenyl)acetyl-CoA isomerase